MLSLIDAQELLGKYILREEKSPMLLNSVIPGGKLSPDSALRVYRNDYLARMTSVLGENYPAVWSVLGDEFFFLTCREFINNFESKSFDIGDFGGEFPTFLKTQKLGMEFPFLMDLAIFEKNFLRIFHSELKAPVQLDIKTKNPLDLRFKFIEGVHLQKSPFPIFKIWEMRNIPNDKRNEMDINWKETTNLVLFKNKSGIKTSFFKESQMDILEKLSIGVKLGDSLKASATEEEVGEIFKFISSSGILLEIIEQC
jgi:hypothetical protein